MSDWISFRFPYNEFPPMMKGLSCFQISFEGIFRDASKRSTLALLFSFFNSSLYLFIFDNFGLLCAAWENSDGIHYGWSWEWGQNTPSCRKMISRKCFRKIKSHFLEMKHKWYLHFLIWTSKFIFPCHFMGMKVKFILST